MEMKLGFQTKANALKEAQRNERVIRDLMKLPDNRKCINCNSLAPQYVCTTFCTVVCLTCSGIHREFTHRVKSVSMAKFTSDEVTALGRGGNQRAKDIYLREWNPHIHSAPDRSDIQSLREFIKDTYVEGRYSGDTKIRDEAPRVQEGNNGTTYSQSLRKPSDDQYSNISHEVVNEKFLYDKHHVKNTNGSLSPEEEAHFEQRLSRHLEKLNSFSREMRETIQALELKDSPNAYSGEATPMQEAVLSNRSRSDTISSTVNEKDMTEVLTESEADLRPHLYESTSTPQSSPSSSEMSFSSKFQAMVLKMMENKKGSARGSKPDSKPPTPQGVQTLQTCPPIGEQTMTSSENWAFLDSPVQRNMCPSPKSPNFDSLTPVSNMAGMRDSSNIQLSDISGSSPKLILDSWHGVPSQLPKSSTSNSKLAESEALFAATFSSFSWSQDPSSCGSREGVPHETPISPQPLKPRNPFDADNELTYFQGTMPSREEHLDLSFSTRLLRSSSSLSTSSQFYPLSSSPCTLMPLEGSLYSPQVPQTCSYSRQPPNSPQTLGTGHKDMKV
uniref:Arf-GAP domain-containing protein n=1 Tax=Kalanchoe fedtschenkoi TaxID=63787 RepID=A0A7N0RH40_KALFE